MGNIHFSQVAPEELFVSEVPFGAGGAARILIEVYREGEDDVAVDLLADVDLEVVAEVVDALRISFKDNGLYTEDE